MISIVPLFPPLIATFLKERRHPSFKPKSSLHFRDFAFSQRNWKLEKNTLIRMCYPISSFSIRFSDSTSDFQPENIPHFREKCKLMDEGCQEFRRPLLRSEGRIPRRLRRRVIPDTDPGSSKNWYWIPAYAGMTTDTPWLATGWFIVRKPSKFINDRYACSSETIHIDELV
jgi:hypothetical protein